MTQVVTAAYKAYDTINSFTNTDVAKQKLIQSMAFLMIATAVYNAGKTRMTQATISTTGAVVLWMNQDAFLHKALSANVQSFGVENQRLSDLLSHFEQIGMDLKSLSAAERAELKDQMEQAHNLFQAMTLAMNKSSEALNRSVEEKTSKFDTARGTLISVMEATARTLYAVNKDTTAEEVAKLNLQIQGIASIAQSLIEEK